MATSIRFRRGTTAQHATFTGAEGEMTVDTTKKVVVVHDGATAGGIPMAPASADHNSFANKQGGTTDEFYHVTAAEKTVIENTSGANTGDQDLSGYHLLADRAYGEIHCEDGSTPQDIATGTTYTKMTCFNHDGESYNATPDQANDKLTITKAGKYLVNATVSGGCGTNNVTFKIAAFLGGAEMHQVHAHTKYGTAGDKSCAAMSGIVNIASVPADLDLRARHDNVGTIALTVTYANLNAVYLGA